MTRYVVAGLLTTPGVPASSFGIRKSSVSDVNDDGVADLIVHFNRVDLVDDGQLAIGTTRLVPFFVSPRNRRYDPRRPDFMDVAGGFPVLTGGAGGGCTILVTSGTP